MCSSDLHLVLVARVAERRAGGEASGQQRLGPRVHHVRRGVEVDALEVVGLAVAVDEVMEALIDRCEVGHVEGFEDLGLAYGRCGRQPGTVRRRVSRLRHGYIVSREVPP